MELFRIFEKKTRRLVQGEINDGPIPTASDVPTAGGVPAASSTPDTSSHPIGAEILIQGVDPITA